MAEFRTNVVLPADLLKEIDRVAGPRRRSAFLAEAAEEKLAKLRFAEAAAGAFGAWKDEDHPELKVAEDMEPYLIETRKATNHRISERR